MPLAPPPRHRRRPTSPVAGRLPAWARLRGGRTDRQREAGQILIIFTIALVGVISVAGLLVDGGMAWTNRRMAQNAADVAALAAAKTWSTTADSAQSTTAARTIATTNLFLNNYTDCQGTSRNNGVVVNIPPTSGAFSGQSGYIEVQVQRPMRTSFSAIVGQSCWMVSARAVAIATTNDVATCNFCSLNNTTKNHTLVLNNSATLRVDGDIYVNSQSGGYTPGACSTNKYKVCGDGFDIFGDGGYISAKTISTVGGWETHDQNIATADGLAPGCTEHPNPPAQAQTANVCIHMPVLADPLNNPSKPGSVVNPPAAGSPPVAGANGCPSGATVPSGTAASPSLLTITSNKTICPGTYYGGLKVTGGTTTMQPGTYIFVGGGFQILNSASMDGRSGVLIYSESGTGASNSTSQATDLVPDPISGHVDLKTFTIASSKNPANPADIVTFTVTLTPTSGGLPTPAGYVDFYDGDVQVCAAQPITVKQVGKNVGIATCSTSWGIWGTRAIAAVYSGDTIYNPDGANLTETITQPNGLTAGPITLDTTGKVDLFGQKSGPYAGLVLFQERASDLTITLAPGDSRAGHCNGNFMTQGVPPSVAAPPDACGDIGGLQGTIYAPNPGALVLIEASGMANLQVIAGMIEVDTAADARFGFQASLFVNSSIHLVE